MDCYIFGAGEESLPAAIPPRGDVLVIAADGGYAAACRAFGTPDLVVGDMDSLGYTPEGVTAIHHPPEKDETDLFLAVSEGLSRGADRFLIYGALGARLDHTVANLQVLSHLAEAGVEGYLFGADDTAVTALRGGERLEFSSDYYGTISVLTLGAGASGVSLRGLKYPMTEGALRPTFPLGISNEFWGEGASVSLAEGVLLIFFPMIKNVALPTKIRENENKTLRGDSE